MLGEIYLFGYCVKENYQKALSLLKSIRNNPYASWRQQKRVKELIDYY